MPILPGLRRRNPVARSPLLRKGGVHEKSKSGLRGEAKQQLQDELVAWQDGLDAGYLTTTQPRPEDGDTLSLGSYSAIMALSHLQSNRRA
jgi:hypothetical protein